jgi:protein-disulfide isomerase
VKDQPVGRAGSAKGIASSAAKPKLFLLMGLVMFPAVAAALVGLGCGSSSKAQPTPGIQATLAAQGTPAAQSTPKTININVGDNPSKGPADAKVTIVEFADFQGTHSASFAQQTLPQILANYGDKIRFVFLNDILGSTTYSEKAAEAGECANVQGSFWPYHDLLFQNQQALTDLTTPDPTAGLARVVESLKGYAAQLGLDTVKFNDCLDSGQSLSALQADRVLADQAVKDAGLATLPLPAFFINGNYLSGAKPYDVFKQAIDAALAAAK